MVCNEAGPDNYSALIPAFIILIDMVYVCAVRKRKRFALVSVLK